MRYSDPAGYENTGAIETIYVRVINRESSSCFIDSSFNIQLTDLPTPTQPTVYRFCDDTASRFRYRWYLKSFY